MIGISLWSYPAENQIAWRTNGVPYLKLLYEYRPKVITQNTDNILYSETTSFEKSLVTLL